MNNPAKQSAANSLPDNRRGSVRYLTTGTVWFQWLAKDGNWYNAIGTTRDVGNGGLFIVTESTVPMASTLRLVVTLPTARKSGTYLCLSGAGYVRHVRRESNQTSGFGASAVFHTEVPMSKK